MPRTKKRKQGLVAKLNSKSFSSQKDAAVVLSLRAQLPKDPSAENMAGTIPDYILQNLTADSFAGIPSAGEDVRLSVGDTADVERMAIERTVPLGVINLGNVADSRWILRRFLSALHLDHLKLEKQLYDRMYLLVQSHVANGPIEYASRTAFDSKVCRVWDFLGGMTKIVDGVRKPLTAILRDSLINNEGSRAAREMWALLLVAITPLRGCTAMGTVKIFRSRPIKVRSVKSSIESAAAQLASIRVAKIDTLHTEDDQYAKLSVAPMELLAESVVQASARAWLYQPTPCTTISATKAALTRMNKADPRRTRQGIVFYAATSGPHGSPSSDDYAEVLVSPHKALIRFASMLYESATPYRAFGCADPKALLIPLLEKDPKSLGMDEVIRAVDRIWPNRGTMLSNQHGNYSLRDGCFRWHVIPIQHARHTT
jgi:hypothetical protein